MLTTAGCGHGPGETFSTERNDDAWNKQYPATTTHAVLGEHAFLLLYENINHAAFGTSPALCGGLLFEGPAWYYLELIALPWNRVLGEGLSVCTMLCGAMVSFELREEEVSNCEI